MNGPSLNTTASRQIAGGLEGELRELHEFDPARHLLELLFPAMLIVGFWVGAYGWELRFGDEPWIWWWGTGVWVTAIAMNSCFLLIHEGTHGLLHRNPRLNWLFGFLLALAGFCSFTAYKTLHLRHHTYLGDPRDPDEYKNYFGSPALVWFLQLNRLAWATLAYVLIIPWLALRHAGLRDRRLIVVELAVMAAVYSSLIGWIHWQTLLAVWVAPFVLVNFMINIRGITQHGVTDAKDPFLASRTVTPGPVVKFFLLNENYHLEHHLFPNVPSYRLERLHQLIADRLPRRVVCRSYLGFVWEFLRAAIRRDERPIGLMVNRAPEELIAAVESKEAKP